MREIFVEKAYEDKSVLITGSTGFVGKVVVEKLLRQCKNIKNIYILLRSKKGEGIEKRFESFKNLIVFNKLKKIDPHALDKLKAIEGDLMEENSGISKSDEEYLKKNLNFIIHCAASVRFDEPLKIALQINTISTRNMLKLGEKCENLKGFVHCSTAYSNTNQKVIYEKIYEPIFDYNHLITLVENNSDDELEKTCEIALQTFPNTYVFTKNLAEKLVSDHTHLPIAIVRPSIICPSMNEPEIGWVDSSNGPMGVLLGASSGILRTIHGNGDLICDLIPCDYVVNCLAVAGASISSSPTKTLEIYNCISSQQMPMTWNKFLDLGRKKYVKYPSTKVLWYPGGRICSSYVGYLLYFIFFQFLPACLIDICAVLAGQKRWAVKLQWRIFDSLKVFEYFICNSWEWRNNNCQLLSKMINVEERDSFNFDISTMDYNQYVENWVIGSRRFLMKLDDTSLPEARRKFVFLYWLDFIVKSMFYIGIAYFLIQMYSRIIRPIIEVS